MKGVHGGRRRDVHGANGSGYVLDDSWTVRLRVVNILAILDAVPAKPVITGTDTLEMVAALSNSTHAARMHCLACTTLLNFAVNIPIHQFYVPLLNYITQPRLVEVLWFILNWDTLARRVHVKPKQEHRQSYDEPMKQTTRRIIHHWLPKECNTLRADF